MSKILALVLLLAFPVSIETELQSQSSVARLSSNSQVQPAINAVNSGYSYLTRFPLSRRKLVSVRILDSTISVSFRS
jgi:hypothetical protein